jgi:hypothetical protein
VSLDSPPPFFSPGDSRRLYCRLLHAGWNVCECRNGARAGNALAVSVLYAWREGNEPTSAIAVQAVREIGAENAEKMTESQQAVRDSFARGDLEVSHKRDK